MITLYLSNKIAAFLFITQRQQNKTTKKRIKKQEHQQKNKQNCFFPCQIYSSKQLKF